MPVVSPSPRVRRGATQVAEIQTEAAQRLDRGGRARASSDGSCCCRPMVEAVRVVAEHRRPRSRSSSSSTGSILRPGSVFSTSADAPTLRRPDRRPPRAPSASNTRVVTGSGRRFDAVSRYSRPPQTRARPYPEAQGLPARLQRVRDEGAGQSSGRHPRPRRQLVQRRASSSSFNLTPMLFVGVMTAITLGVHRQGCADRRLRHDSRTAATLARFSHV
jgi:hypothetical protein